MNTKLKPMGKITIIIAILGVLYYVFYPHVKCNSDVTKVTIDSIIDGNKPNVPLAGIQIKTNPLKNEKTKLIAKAIENMGYVVNRVTAEDEGRYALLALIPKDYIANSFVVDIGSGNTKISWYEGNALKTVEAPGAKYYQNNKTDHDVYEEVKSASSQVPSDKRKNCFIIGGVPFSLAKQTRSNDTERFTTLKNADAYSAGDDVKIKSGLNIYRALCDGTGTNNYIFDWDANFTIGFLTTLN